MCFHAVSKDRDGQVGRGREELVGGGPGVKDGNSILDDDWPEGNNCLSEYVAQFGQ